MNLTVPQLARRWACCQRTVRNYIATGRLPVMRLSARHLVVPLAAVEAYERAATIPATCGADSVRRARR